MENRSLIGSSVVPIRMVFLMWLSFVMEFVYGFPLSAFGILPREPLGLIGIFTAPLLHGSLNHIISNTVPLLFLGVVLFYFYRNIASSVFLKCYFITNILVWLFARTYIHIGSSGVVYGIAFFLIFLGIFRRDFMSLLISIVVMLLYGWVFYGLLPSDPQISFESHIAGAIVGTANAIYYSKWKRI